MKEEKQHEIASFFSYFSVWFGVIFVREGIYTDGVFRFNISLPKRFPHTLEVPVINQSFLSYQNDILP